MKKFIIGTILAICATVVSADCTVTTVYGQDGRVKHCYHCCTAGICSVQCV